MEGVGLTWEARERAEMKQRQIWTLKLKHFTTDRYFFFFVPH